MNALLRNRKGQGLTEYVLILVVVISLVVYMIGKFKAPMKTQIDGLGTQIAQPAQ